MSNNERLAQAIVDFYRLKDEISELTRRRDGLKQLIANEMNKRGKDRLRSGKVAVTRRLIETKRISRENLPEEIYEQYAVPSTYYTYTCKKEK
jgi:hypothetical protein